MKRATLAFKSLPAEIGPFYRVSARCLAKLISYLPLTVGRTLLSSLCLAFEMTRDRGNRFDRALAVFVLPFMGLASLLVIVTEAICYAAMGRLASVYYRDYDGNVQ